jgi:hypothetical protein
LVAIGGVGPGAGAAPPRCFQAAAARVAVGAGAAGRAASAPGRRVSDLRAQNDRVLDGEPDALEPAADGTREAAGETTEQDASVAADPLDGVGVGAGHPGSTTRPRAARVPQLR